MEPIKTLCIRMFNQIGNLVASCRMCRGVRKKHYAEAEISPDTLLQQEFSSAHVHIYGDKLQSYHSIEILADN